jgi:hypothetical protein
LLRELLLQAGFFVPELCLWFIVEGAPQMGKQEGDITGRNTWASFANGWMLRLAEGIKALVARFLAFGLGSFFPTNRPPNPRKNRLLF